MLIICYKTKNVQFGLLFTKQSQIDYFLKRKKICVKLILYFSEMFCQIVSM